MRNIAFETSYYGNDPAYYTIDIGLTLNRDRLTFDLDEEEALELRNILLVKFPLHDYPTPSIQAEVDY